MKNFSNFFQAINKGPTNVDTTPLGSNTTETTDFSNIGGYIKGSLGSNNTTSGMNFINAGRTAFIYGIISNWYLLVVIPAMTITYNVFKALQDHGILDMLYNEVKGSLDILVKTSMECPQKITDIGEFLNCLGW
ncbi:MAG: hypothetical protein AABY27_04190 [Pseudomonadota bacterium]